MKEPSPERDLELRFSRFAPEVWDALGRLPRTGWVNRGIKSPETVQEHTIALRSIAAFLHPLLPEEQDGLLDMLEVHDWPEAIHGDQVILADDEEGISLKAAKFESEHRALISICAKLGEEGKTILSLWLRFETSKDEAALLARQIDKYQAVEKALEYEKAQGVPLFKEFLDYSTKYISHPLLLEKLRNLEREAEVI